MLNTTASAGLARDRQLADVEARHSGFRSDHAPLGSWPEVALWEACPNFLQDGVITNCESSSLDVNTQSGPRASNGSEWCKRNKIGVPDDLASLTRRRTRWGRAWPRAQDSLDGGVTAEHVGRAGLKSRLHDEISFCWPHMSIHP